MSLFELQARVRRGLSEPTPDLGRIEALAAQCGCSFNIPHGAIPAAVLILFYPRSHAAHFVLTKRAAVLTVAPGDIVFPGGHATDGEHPERTAVREAGEEVEAVVAPEDVVGMLPRYAWSYNSSVYCIQPVVAVTTQTQLFVPQRDEVDEVFEVPIECWLNRVARDSPFFAVGPCGEVIGCGAALSLELLRLTLH